jgi:multicomponent Na+:H+ antiporter subunit E
MKTRRWLIAGVLFGVLWVFVRGAEPTPSSILANLLVGSAVGFPVAYVFRRLYEDEFALERLFRIVPYIFAYALVFTKEVLVANFDVAYRVLSPGMPIEPQVILVPLRVETSSGVTTIANSITITPGTITLDHDPDENALYVHIIDGRDIEAVVEPIRTWEDYALVIFDEEASPDDPAPEITVHPPDYPPEPKTATDHLETYERGDTGEENEKDDSPGGEDVD